MLSKARQFRTGEPRLPRVLEVRSALQYCHAIMERSKAIPWRVIIGFVFGLALIEALAAITASVLTGLPPLHEALLFLLLALAAAYIVHGFTMTVWSYLLIVACAAIWIDWYGPRSGSEIGTFLVFSVFAASFVGVRLRGKLLFQEKPLFHERLGLFYYSASLACALWILLLVVSYGINGNDLPGVIMMAVIGVTFFFVGRSQGRFFDLWSATQPFDTQFARFIASILPNVALVTLIYLCVVTAFASLYYHIDNCDHADGLCRLVTYQRYTGSDEGGQRCWTFSSVAPLAADPDSSALCKTHKTDKPFTINRFLPYLYFSMVTSTTVGYGDIAPLSVSAIWLVIIHHVVSIIVLIALVAHIAGFQPTSKPVQSEQPK